MAKAFRAKGDDIIVSSRREHLLEEIESKHPGIIGRRLDMADPADIQRFAKALLAECPQLNVVIHNAGMMKDEALLDSDTSTVAEETINTNLLGTMRLNAALLRHLGEVSHPVIAVVTSGLAFVPRVIAPAYAATKAGLHSWTQYVATKLQGAHQKTDPHAMPLEEYLQKTMDISNKRLHRRRFLSNVFRRCGLPNAMASSPTSLKQ